MLVYERNISYINITDVKCRVPSNMLMAMPVEVNNEEKT